MRKKLSLSIWLKPIAGTLDRYITCEITVENGGSVQLSTGVRIDPENWLPHIEKQTAALQKRKPSHVPSRLKHTGWKSKEDKENATTINGQIDAMEIRLRKIHRDLDESDKEYTARDVKLAYKGLSYKGNAEKKDTILRKKGLLETADELLSELSLKIDQSGEKPDGLTESTYTTYKIRLDNLRQFVKVDLKKKDVSIADLSEDFAFRFKDYLEKRHVQKQRKRVGLGTDQIKKHLEFLRKVLFFADKKKYIAKIGVEKVTAKPTNYAETDLVYLEPEELQHLENVAFTGKSLQETADCFIFQCYTGLAYAELKALSQQEHIIQTFDSNQTWLRIRRGKTRRRTKRLISIPLLPKALELLRKYQENEYCRKIDRCFPVPENYPYNRLLKQMASIAKIPKEITSHVGRKTFVMVGIQHGISTTEIAALIGDSVRVVEQHYMRITDKMKQKAMNTLAMRLDADKLKAG